MFWFWFWNFSKKFKKVPEPPPGYVLKSRPERPEFQNEILVLVLVLELKIHAGKRRRVLQFCYLRICASICAKFRWFNGVEERQKMYVYVHIYDGVLKFSDTNKYYIL